MTDETELPRCEICGEPMPEGETMFKFHGFSGPCPAPPLPRPAAIKRQTSYERALARLAALEAELADERKWRDEWQATALRWKQETYLLERDAARYRWLREAPPYSARWPRWRIEHWSGVWNPVQGSDMDAAIDAARKERTT